MGSTVYLESTIPSYYTSDKSRDLVILAHQQITTEWWDKYLPEYEVYISELVLQEISAGDTDAAKKRNDVVADFPVLAINETVEKLAEIYVKNITILKEAVRDALHLAVASAHGMDYIVTWNCKHIARGEVMRAFESINDSEGILSPTICTPEELIGE